MNNFREFYEKNGVNYDAFLQRMMGREALIEKYIRIFMADPTFAELEHAVSTQDYTTAGFKAHTLKGIALNLNFEKLGILSMNIVDSVRNGDTSNVEAQFAQVKAVYEYIVDELGE